VIWATFSLLGQELDAPVRATHPVPLSVAEPALHDLDLGVADVDGPPFDGLGTAEMCFDSPAGACDACVGFARAGNVKALKKLL